MNRDELEQRLQEIITGCPNAANGACEDCDCPGMGVVYRVMTMVDAYTVTLGLLPDELPTTELWTAEQVANYVGLLDANAGRSWLSRQRIKRCGVQEHPDSGRPVSLYSANHVRAAQIRKSVK